MFVLTMSNKIIWCRLGLCSEAAMCAQNATCPEVPEKSLRHWLSYTPLCPQLMKVCSFPSRIFHSKSAAPKGLQILGFVLLRSMSRIRSFFVPYLLIHGTSAYIVASYNKPGVLWTYSSLNGHRTLMNALILLLLTFFIIVVVTMHQT